VFGCWEHWGDTFELRGNQNDYNSVSDLYEVVQASRAETATPPAAPNSMDINDIINLDALKAYRDHGTDRRMNLLNAYIDRVEAHGHQREDG
jgi:hypothetical protein